MKTNNCIKYLTVLTCLLMFLACGDEVETTLNVDNLELEFEQTGGEQTLTVESNSNWVIVSPETFIKASPSNGSGTEEVTVTVEEHKSGSAVDETYLLVIRSADGTKTVNVRIIIKGLVIKDKYLMVTNYAEFTIAGQEHVQDSLLINTNVEWEAKGPEWIEAWDGTRWRPLSMEKGNVSGTPNSYGISVLRVRTASVNQEIDNRTSTITISEKRTGEVPFSLKVEQIGREYVMPKALLPLYDSFCTDWVCGNDVESFYWYASNTRLSSSELMDEAFIQENFALSDAGYVNFRRGLQENSTMYLYTRAVTKNGAIANNYRYIEYQIPSSINQPRAPIEKAFKTNAGWYTKIGMNDLTSYYICYATDNQEQFSWPDVYLAWVLNSMVKSNINDGGDLPFYLLNEPDEDTYPVQGDIDIFTWAMGSDAHMSSIPDRFISVRDNERKIPAKHISAGNNGKQIGGYPRSEIPNLKYRIIRK